MKNLLLIAFIASSATASAQDRALSSDEYTRILTETPELLEAREPISDECHKLANKSRRKLIWASVALGFASGLGNTSTAYTSTKVNGKTYLSTITYTDATKVAHSRALSADAMQTYSVKTANEFEAAGCSNFYTINY